MKRLLLIASIFSILSVQALSGAAQVKIEGLYDIYRERYLTPLSPEKQVDTLTKVGTALADYKTRSTVTPLVRDMVSYLEHLLCHTKSLITGYYCQDNYYPASLLTTNKSELTLTQIRNLLIREHSDRRIARGMGGLAQSEILNSIAQNYAYRLCAAGEITHTLGGSTLKQRYEEGAYDYVWGGENLGLGQENIMELLDQLTTSIHHRENMYQEEFNELGIGQCDTIWVLNYGAR